MKLTFPPPEQIREMRKKSGLTQKQAAELISYSAKAWRNWEKGYRKMRKTIFDQFIEKTRHLRKV